MLLCHRRWACSWEAHLQVQLVLARLRRPRTWATHLGSKEPWASSSFVTASPGWGTSVIAASFTQASVCARQNPGTSHPATAVVGLHLPCCVCTPFVVTQCLSVSFLPAGMWWCSTAVTKWTTRAWARSTRGWRRAAYGAALMSSTASTWMCCLFVHSRWAGISERMADSLSMQRRSLSRVCITQASPGRPAR